MLLSISVGLDGFTFSWHLAGAVAVLVTVGPAAQTPGRKVPPESAKPTQD